MNKVILLLVAFWAFIAIANARPLMFFADQTDAPFNISNSWSGIAYAFVTLKKGVNYHRVRIFGTNHVNETLTNAWINYANGTIIDYLAVNIDQSYRYFLGDLRIDYDQFTALVSEEIYVTVATNNHKNGAITGYFRCRPHSGIAIMTADQVIGGSSSSASGIGWGAIHISTIHSLPEDVLAQDASIEANSLFYGRVLTNSTNVTSVTFNAPANTSQTAPVLATANLTGIYGDAHFGGVAIDDDFYSIDNANSYYLLSAGSGTLRGQIYPVLSYTQRRIPYRVDTVTGTTIPPGAGFRTLRYANQEGNERNPNTYISLQADLISTGNYTYVGVATFTAATTNKNFELVRALTIELNGRIGGTGTWFFEIFDATTGEFVPAATWSSASTWTPAYIEYWGYDVQDFSSPRRQLAVRISVNSASATSLYLDLFGVRSWVPFYQSNQVYRSVAQFLNLYPGKFENGTIINEGTDL